MYSVAALLIAVMLDKSTNPDSLKLPFPGLMLIPDEV
jgi:hypothetical protein